MNVARLVVVVTFTFSGAVKLNDPLGTAYKLQDYAQAFGLQALMQGVTPVVLSVILAMLEFSVGIYLLFGIRRRRTSILALAFMLAFTPLTLYLAVANPVRDCGCFGDALVLTNWQTFWKNVVLLAAAILLVCKTRLMTRLITELSAQMSAIFTERFAGINRYFGEIFRELFGGGHAELRLTDATDPLETGIEIIVQPPGKIIKNLSALSGGEQAFVAICIYFAILRVNPAPFVLIDEIEAALDDVNVGKFAAYLHRMTDHTQFISITHRRGTMEQGDVLYGVTMEEEGISKLLRLDVAEMEKKFGKSLN